MACAAQNFGMGNFAHDSPPDYIRQCGQRLEMARVALGYSNRSAFVRLLAGETVDEADLKRRLNQLEKWERGTALVRPWFVDRLKRIFGVTQDYIYSNDKSGLRSDLALKIEELEVKNAHR